MNKINRIIREEIKKLILTEAIDFTDLKTYADELNNSLGEISNISNNNGIDKGLRQFLYNFVVYCVQIIAAINRCVQANTINEASIGSLSRYGINLPPELGGNIVNDFKQGYYGTKRFFQRGGYGNSKSSGYANGKQVNANTVPSVKLSVLLQNLPRWQRDYQTAYTKYDLANNVRLTSDFNKIIGSNGIIPNIQNEYNMQMQNAQVNP